MNLALQTLFLFLALYTSIYIVIELVLLFIACVAKMERTTNFTLTMFLSSLSWALFFYFGN